MNRLTTCKKMVEDLFKLSPSANIYIIDNASTYQPLLDWYEEVKNDIKIIKNNTNLGPWSFFYSGHYNNINSEIYIYSDADLELNPNMPYNWQEIFLHYLEKYKRKPSLALRMDDIPESSDILSIIKNHQSVCWYPTEEENIYKAVTDMTFSMDKKSNGYRYESIRIAGNFTCRHIPWYINFDNITEEEKYYLEHINPDFLEALYSNINFKKLKNTL